MRGAGCAPTAQARPICGAPGGVTSPVGAWKSNDPVSAGTKLPQWATNDIETDSISSVPGKIAMELMVNVPV